MAAVVPAGWTRWGAAGATRRRPTGPPSGRNSSGRLVGQPAARNALVGRADLSWRAGQCACGHPALQSFRAAARCLRKGLDGGRGTPPAGIYGMCGAGRGQRHVCCYASGSLQAVQAALKWRAAALRNPNAGAVGRHRPAWTNTCCGAARTVEDLSVNSLVAQTIDRQVLEPTLRRVRQTTRYIFWQRFALIPSPLPASGVAAMTPTARLVQVGAVVEAGKAAGVGGDVGHAGGQLGGRNGGCRPNSWNPGGSISAVVRAPSPVPARGTGWWCACRSSALRDLAGEHRGAGHQQVDRVLLPDPEGPSTRVVLLRRVTRELARSGRIGLRQRQCQDFVGIGAAHMAVRDAAPGRAKARSGRACSGRSAV